MAPLLLIFFTLLLSSLLCYSFFSKKRGGALRPPPGPKGWPILGNLPQLGPKPHHTLHALSKAHGPLLGLRFGFVDVVVAASAAVAAEFLKVRDANFSNRPPNIGIEHTSYNYQDVVFGPYGTRWRVLRKLCALHLFSTKALENLRPIRAHEVGLMVQSLARGGSDDNGNGSPTLINLGETVNMCVTNALAGAVMGWRVFKDPAEAREFKEMVAEMMKVGGVFNIADVIPWLRWLDLQGVEKKMKQLHKRYDEFINRFIAGRQGKKEAAGGSDFMSALLSLTDQEPAEGQEEGKITETNVKALLLDLFTGGTDTSTSTIEWAMSELIRQPKILKEAQVELDSVVGRARLVSESDIPNLPLLQAVVKETFRLHPPAPMSLPRMAAEECEINGYCIPKQATLLVHIWAIGRDPAIWPDPLEFSPARFLPGGANESLDVKGSDYELIPFGAGRRICAGLSLGLRMVQLMTATLVHAFDWTLPDGQPPEKLDMEEAYGLTLQRAVPLVVRPVPRLLQEAYESIEK